MGERYEIYWLKKGTVLNEKYRIDDVIGEGGFGIVYRGYDLTLHMDVAIKEFFPRRYAMREPSSDEIRIYKGEERERFVNGMEKFLEEARTLAKFHHLPNIVAIRDFFYENNTAYLINEYIEDMTIHQYVEKKGKMEPGQVLARMEPILSSLERIHETGLLHRDISPDNIILRENGEAVLIDFGAARIANVQEDLTITVFFKRGYSAEEQYVSSGRQGMYTDVYAICATMYYMLTGIQPEESVQRHIRDQVVPLSRKKEIAMPLYQKNAIMKGMAVRASNRYQNIGELRKALSGKRHRSVLRHMVVGAAMVSLLMGGIWLWNGYPDIHAGRQRSGNPAGETRQISGGETAGGISVSAAAVSGVAAEEAGTIGEASSGMPAGPTPAPVYEIPDVCGMKKSSAIKWIRRLADPELIIEFRTAYSKKITENHIIRQSIRAGEYRSGEYEKLLLTVSRGQKPKKKAAATPTPSPSHTPGPTPKKEQGGSGNTEDGEFAGQLPW